MVSRELRDIIVCPETKQELTPADGALIERLNERIEAGELEYRNGQSVLEPLYEGLLREDGKVLYAIRDDIPVMLVEESIDVSAFSSEDASAASGS